MNPNQLYAHAIDARSISPSSHSCVESHYFFPPCHAMQYNTRQRPFLRLSHIYRSKIAATAPIARPPAPESFEPAPVNGVIGLVAAAFVDDGA